MRWTVKSQAALNANDVSRFRSTVDARGDIERDYNSHRVPRQNRRHLRGARATADLAAS